MVIHGNAFLVGRGTTNSAGEYRILGAGALEGRGFLAARGFQYLDGKIIGLLEGRGFLAATGTVTQEPSTAGDSCCASQVRQIYPNPHVSFCGVML